MANVGGGNPIPFKVGGGPSTSESAYGVMRSAVGEGGYAAEGTIEAAWRWARARGATAALCMGRAAAGYFPNRCTDSIGVYETILDISPSPESNDELRRQAVLDRWIDAIDYSTSGIESRLQEIDSRFSIVDNDYDTSTVTQHGRAFEDWDPTDSAACGPDYGDSKSSAAPNYSSDFNFIVKFALDAGDLTSDSRHKLARAKELLNRLLPAWINWMFVRTTTGFVLDVDLLDLGGIGT